MMRGRGPTIADIAARAGVAPMTVSRAINSSGYVKEETRRRVMDAVRESNYRPNQLARSLRGQKTNVVGLVLPDLADPSSAELARVIEETLAASGYSCFLATSQCSVEREQAALASFDDQRVDGMLVVRHETQTGDESLDALAGRGLPLVMVGCRCEKGNVDHVTADYRKGGFEATTHLIKRGHRRIAFIGASLGNGSGLAHFQGYLEAMREHGLPVPASYLDPDDSKDLAQANGYAGLVRLMTLVSQPTAVFTRNDRTAMGAISAASELGMQVPGDMAICGFDNATLSAYTTPPLTTVDPSMGEQGRTAAEFLLQRLTGGSAGAGQDAVLDCRLVVRKSI